MDWTSCIICQKTTSELTCPINNRRYDSMNVYEDFLENVEEFRKLDEIPIEIEHCQAFAAEHFVKNRASWHRSCHQTFNNSKLERVRTRKRKLEKVHDLAEQNNKKVNRLSRQSCTSALTKTCIFLRIKLITIKNNTHKFIADVSLCYNFFINTVLYKRKNLPVLQRFFSSHFQIYSAMIFNQKKTIICTIKRSFISCYRGLPQR